MAKAKEAPKPFFPLRHEFVASMDRMLHEAGMLRDVAQQLLALKLISNPEIAKMLRERIEAFDHARFGERE